MIQLAALLAAIFAAVCVAARLRLWGLSLNLEIQPVGVASLLVGAFIAFFLQYHLAAQLTDKRAEKNLLIDSLRDVLSSLRSCRDVFIACYESGKLTKENRRSVFILLRKLANSLDNVETMISLSQYSKLVQDCQPVMNCYVSYKSALTGVGVGCNLEPAGL